VKDGPGARPSRRRRADARRRVRAEPDLSCLPHHTPRLTSALRGAHRRRLFAGFADRHVCYV
jgi:hypothetical protein